MQKSVLGKGLASLLPGAATPAASIPPAPSFPEGAVAAGEPSFASRDRHMGISMIGVDEIAVNQYQPRRDFDDVKLLELSDSIQANGIIQPLVVRKTASGYQLIAGERRLRAAKLAGLKQVPIVIRKSTDREALEIAIVENVQRQDLNCIDEALAYFQLMNEFNLTQEETAKRVGKERATVANHLRLLRLPEAIIDDLKRGILTYGHGKALAGLEDHELRLRARAQIVEKSLSVRETERLVEELKRQNEASAAENGPVEQKPVERSPLRSRMATLSQDLSKSWGTRVDIKGSERRGKIVLHYSTRQELERLLAAMQNEKVWGAQ